MKQSSERHACSRASRPGASSNETTTTRRRLASPQASRYIKEALKDEQIALHDPAASLKHRSYVPFWAADSYV